MPYALVLDKLSKTYPNGVQALKGIDLKIEKGDFFALLGPNGAGKSTVISIVTSLIEASSGEVRIFNYQSKRDWFHARLKIGLVPQEFNFYQFEIVEEIVLNQAGYYGISRAKAYPQVRKLLKQMGLWEKRHVQARALSGGMKRRLMIARALVHQPELLILDEPTAGVDIDLRRSMWTFLTELNASGVTIILTTHYLEEAEQLCKNIAIIDQGQIITHTDMESLLQRLEKEVLLLELSNTPQPLPKLSAYQHLWRSPELLQIEVRRNSGLNDLLEQLLELGCVLHGVRRQSGRLEELFMNLLNKNLSEEHD